MGATTAVATPTIHHPTTASINASLVDGHQQMGVYQHPR